MPPLPFLMSQSTLQAPPVIAKSPYQPDWLRVAREQAAQRFNSLPRPSRTDESWRFSNLQAFDPQDFIPACPVSTEISDSLLPLSLGADSHAGNLVFANDHLIARTRTALSEQGVLWMPLEEAIELHSPLVQRYFMQSESLFGSAKHLALHQLSVRAGTFLYVPKGVQIEAPFQTFHWLSGSGQSVFPHTLIVAEEGSSVTFVDWFQSHSDSHNLACGVHDIHVGPAAKVSYVSIQDWSLQTVALHSNTTQVSAGGAAMHLSLNLGGRFVRNESVSHLRGAGARSEMLAATVADGTQEFDQRTLQDHASPDTSSDLLYKNALYDQAKTIFAGLIRVAPQAHRTDAYQKVRNLVLSAEAEAVSLPGLEILADQVRCSHGATTGEINPDELFYMQTRGISERDAYRLITFGFLNEVLERLQVESLRDPLQEVLKSRLAGH
jgi:Fe-S cluster assembly protein SufD